jgi:hypothetical protein
MIGFDDIFDDYLDDGSEREELCENVDLFSQNNFPVKSKALIDDEKVDLIVSISNSESENEVESVIDVEVDVDVEIDSNHDFGSNCGNNSGLLMRTDDETFYSVKSTQDDNEIQNYSLPLTFNSRREIFDGNFCKTHVSQSIELEVCRICHESEDGFTDDWVICYGCGEAFHRKCLKTRLKRIFCELPLIYRPKLSDGSEFPDRFSHAPWFCNQCANCPTCQECEEDDDSNIMVEKENLRSVLKSSYVSCRHCGQMRCMACYNDETLNSNVQINRFESLQNYSCPECLRCTNCGIGAFEESASKKRVVLYSDSTLCRPCYLSNQMCSFCPRCKQIYHSLPNHYDFGEAPYDPDFSLCPMIQCDSCSSWTHCQCEGISLEEYKRMGACEDSKFLCVDCKPLLLDSLATAAVNELELDDISAFYSDNDNSTKVNSEPIIKRRGNLMISDNSILFRYWSVSDSWKRSTYRLSITKQPPFKYILTCPELKDGRIESKSLDVLVQIFEKQLHTNHGNENENYSCRQARSPEFILNPQFLLNFLQFDAFAFTFRFTDLISQLRTKMRSFSQCSSARTTPFLQIPKIKGSAVHSKKRRLSLMDLPAKSPCSSPALGNCSSSSSSGTASVNGNFRATVRHLYMQYMHATKADSSCQTIDSFSQGLALRPSSISGFGLFASRPYQINSLIIEYCGEMLTGDDLVNKRDAFYNLLGKRYQQTCYLFRLDETKVIDATHKGNLSRFINHSCDPNCYSRVVQIDGQKRLLIFASRLIEAGEEILYDYKFPDEEQKIPCLCGSEKCRKWMN